MNDRDPDGFVTLHHGGRQPVLERVAWVLALIFTVALLWSR
jgi:hypothetical protein